jgi:hypothetical protein
MNIPNVVFGPEEVLPTDSNHVAHVVRKETYLARLASGWTKAEAGTEADSQGNLCGTGATSDRLILTT